MPQKTFSQHAEELTSRLRNKRDWMLSEPVKHLKYGLWAESYESTLKENFLLADEKIERLCAGRNNLSRHNILNDQQKLVRQVERMTISLARLRHTLDEIAPKRETRRFWLTRNMPNVAPLFKERLMIQAAKAVTDMWKATEGYENLLNAATEQAPFDFSSFKRDDKPGRPPAAPKDLALDIDRLGVPVYNAASALKLSVIDIF